MKTDSMLVLFAHGSRDPNWRKTFESLAASVRADMDRDCVALAYMEFVSPTLHEVVTEASRKGVTTIRILPLFLAGGAHVARDIPEQVADVQRQLPSMRIEVLAPIGEHPQVFGLIRTIARDEGLKLQAETDKTMSPDRGA